MFIPGGASLPLDAAVGIFLRERVVDDEHLTNFGVAEAWESLRLEVLRDAGAAWGAFMKKMVVAFEPTSGVSQDDTANVLGFLSAKLVLERVLETAQPATSLMDKSASLMEGRDDSDAGRAVGERWAAALIFGCQQRFKNNNTVGDVGTTADTRPFTDRREQLAAALIMKRTLRTLKVFRLRSTTLVDGQPAIVPLGWLAAEVPEFLCALIGDLASLFATVAEGEARCGPFKRTPSAARRSPVSFLMATCNDVVMEAFVIAAAALLSHEQLLRETTGKSSPQKNNPKSRNLMNALDMAIENLLWKNTDVWQRALRRWADWHELQAGVGDSKRKLLVVESATHLNRFVDEKLKSERIRAEFAVYQGDSPSRSAAATSLWRLTIRLCETVVMIGSAVEERSPSRSRRVAICLDHAMALPAPDSGDAQIETEVDVFSAVLRLSTIGILAGKSVPDNRAARFWASDRARASAVHDLIITRALRFRSPHVTAIAALISHSMTRQEGSEVSRSGARVISAESGAIVSAKPRRAAPASSPIDISTSKLLDLLTVRDAVSQYTCRVVADAALLHPHIVIPALFNIASAEDGGANAAGPSVAARRNALEVLALLPLRCLDGGDAQCDDDEATLAVVRRRLAQELLTRLGDDELRDRVSAARLFGMVDPDDVVKPLLVAAAGKPDSSGNRRSAAVESLKSCARGDAARGHGQILRAMITAFHEIVEGPAPQPQSAAVVAAAKPTKPFVPVTPRDLLQLAETQSALGSLDDESVETGDQQHPATSNDGKGSSPTHRLKDRLVAVMLPVVDEWVTATVTSPERLQQTQAVTTILSIVFDDHPGDELATKFMSRVIPRLAVTASEALESALANRLVSGGTAEAKSLWFTRCLDVADEQKRSVAAISPLLVIRSIAPRSLSPDGVVVSILGRLAFPTRWHRSASRESDVDVLCSHHHDSAWWMDQQRTVQARFVPEVFRLVLEGLCRQSPQAALELVDEVLANADFNGAERRIAFFSFCTCATTFPSDVHLVTPELRQRCLIEALATILRCGVDSRSTDEAAQKLLRGAFDTAAISITTVGSNPALDHLSELLRQAGNSAREQCSGSASVNVAAVADVCAIIQHAAMTAVRLPDGIHVIRALLGALLSPLIAAANRFAAMSSGDTGVEPQTARLRNIATSLAATVFALVGCMNKVTTVELAVGDDQLRVLCDFGVGCARYSRHAPLQLEGVKLLAAILAQRPDTFIVVGDASAAAVLGALESIATICANPQARQLAEQLVTMIRKGL